ncbi:MAG: recombinase family protein [Bacilli bacterium]|nr:recombinase family protein [Bacilli bacterium]
MEKKAKKGIVDPRRIFGYDVIDSKYVINESEAKIIKEIFNLALIGYNINDIVKTLNNQGYQTLKGSTFKYGTVRHILQNERYAGDALLRKTVCIDYLTKKTVKNDNIVDKYYVSNNHEGIITKEQFQNVQSILNSNKNKSKLLSKTSKYPLTGILYCPKCGRTLKRQHIKSGSSMYVVLNCNHSYNNDFTCKTTSPRYDLVMGATVDAVNLLSSDETLLNSIIDTFDSESHLNALRFSLEMLQDEVTNLHQKLNENYETSIVEDIKSKENTIADLSNHISIEASALIKLEYLKSLNALDSNLNFKDIFSIILATNQKIKLIIAPRKTLDDLTNDISNLLELEPIVSKMHLSEDETRGIFYEVALYE